MDKAEREQRFDGILFSLAEQHPQGVLDVRHKILYFLNSLIHHFQFSDLITSFYKPSPASWHVKLISSQAVTMVNGRK